MATEDSTAQPGVAIVHIGLDKTGTTSIQEFCRYKSEMLRQAGVHYPHPANPAAISHEAFAKAHGFSWNETATPEDSRDAGAHLAGPLDPAREALLLSSEHFGYYVSTATIRRLKGWLDANGYGRVRVVVYLRNQVDWLLSLYSEAIRWGQTGDLAAFHEIARDRLSHLRLLQEWAAVFGQEAMVVRNFDALEAPLLRDFAAAAGLDETARQMAAEYEIMFPNHSLPQVLSEYVRTLSFTMEVNERYDFIANRLSMVRPRFLTELFARRIWALPPDFLAKLPALQAENDLIAATYGVELPPLQGRAAAYTAKQELMTPDAVQAAAMFMLLELISEATGRG